MDDRDKHFLRLILRSPDTGEGWRNVSAMVWPLVEGFNAQPLIEKDKVNLRVRLSEEGQTVVKYAL